MPSDKDPASHVLLSHRLIKSVREIGVVIGVIAAVIAVVMPIRDLAVQQKKANEDAERTNRVLKVTSLTGLIQLLDRDSEIKTRIGKFLNAYKTDEIVLQKAKEFAAGSDAYHSSDFADLREAGHYYEVLGAFIRTGYVDVDLIYSILDFPTTFWERTTKFRHMVRNENWNGVGSPLPDFWENFEWLGGQYEVRHRYQEAKTILQKAVGHYKAAGRTQALADFTAGKMPFRDLELYVVCVNSDHLIAADGGFPKLVGTSCDELRDADGHPLGESLWDASAKKGEGSIRYRMNNPVSHNVEPKITFYEKVADDLLCGVGAYNPE
jgi:cytochrome c